MVEFGCADDWHCSNSHNLQNLQFTRNWIINLADVANLENDKIVVVKLPHPCYHIGCSSSSNATEIL